MPERKRVLWDEKNLEDNETYRRMHPVTIPIVEPKTPYVHCELDEEGGFVDEPRVKEDNSTWDPQVNAFVHQLKEDVSKGITGPVAPVSASGRPMLSTSVVNGELLEKKRVEEFRTLRKAVYADEGAVFKQSLSKKDDSEDEDMAE